MTAARTGASGDGVAFHGPAIYHGSANLEPRTKAGVVPGPGSPAGGDETLLTGARVGVRRPRVARVG